MACLQVGDKILENAILEQKRRQVMVDRLLVYSCLSRNPQEGHRAVRGLFDEETLSRERLRLEETATSHLEQVLAYLFAQAQQV